MRTGPTILTGAFLLLGLGMVPGCEESLPPREEPPDVLVPAEGLTGTLVIVDLNRVQSGGNVWLSMTNTHDEVLSEEAAVRAFVQVRLREYPDSARLLTYGFSDVTSGGLIVGSTLTLPVKQAIAVMQPWDHKTVAGTPFWQFGMPFRRLENHRGEIYYESDTLHLVVDANLQVFKRVPAVHLPRREYAIVYQLWRTTPPTMH